MNSWFDIFSLSGEVPETLAAIRKEYSQEQLMASANLVLKIVEEEKERFPDKDLSRIYIGGFSQGCMVSLAAFLMHQGPKQLGGVVGLSGM